MNVFIIMPHMCENLKRLENRKHFIFPEIKQHVLVWPKLVSQVKENLLGKFSADNFGWAGTPNNSSHSSDTIPRDDYFPGG